LDPQAFAEKSPSLDLIGQWWGVYHRGIGALTLGRFFHSPFTNTAQFYRSRYTQHEFLWDEQARTGSATEIVLERLNLHKPTFDEVMAMLVRHSGQEEQALIMRTDEGWAEPPFNHDHLERDFNLAVLRELATRTNSVSSLSVK
jgi:hypothetical protein